MPAVLDVRPSGYADAAALLADVVATETHDAWHELLATLRNSHGMAGTDDVGSSWGASYDGAVEAVRLASQELNNAFFQLAALLEQTAINYDGAEAASVPGATAHVAVNRWSRTIVRLDDPPSAVGQGDPEPYGWSFLQHAIGMLWPNGHQDRLRASAQAWTKAADRLQSSTEFIGEAARQVLLQRTPEADDAFTAVDAMTVHITDVAASYRLMAEACDTYAEHLDHAHHQILGEIKSFLEWSAGIQVAGGLFAVFTAGISEVVAQAGEATEIARAAKAIREAIVTLGAIVAVGRDAVAATGARVLGVVERLQPLLMRSPQEVELQQAARTEVLRPGGPLPSELPPAPVGATPQAQAITNLAKADANRLAAKPEVQNLKLGHIVDDLYKGIHNPKKVGSGTTADAIRNELRTGVKTAGRDHITKGREYARALARLVRDPQLSGADRAVAQQLLDELRDALGGN